MTPITLTIDDREIQAIEGRNLLQTCLENGIVVPNLCFLEDMSDPPASCRLCFVEIAGVPQPLPSCKVPSAGGHGGEDRHRQGAAPATRCPAPALECPPGRLPHLPSQQAMRTAEHGALPRGCGSVRGGLNTWNATYPTRWSTPSIPLSPRAACCAVGACMCAGRAPTAGC